jgi:predicted nucleotidyltransferase
MLSYQRQVEVLVDVEVEHHAKLLAIPEELHDVAGREVDLSEHDGVSTASTEE